MSPYGYRQVFDQDGAQEQPKLELGSLADGVVWRIFRMSLQDTLEMHESPVTCCKPSSL